MKKLLTLGLALSAVLLAGCGSSQPTTDEAVAPVVEQATGIVATGTETPVVEATPATGAETPAVVEATGAEVVTGK